MTSVRRTIRAEPQKVWDLLTDAGRYTELVEDRAEGTKRIYRLQTSGVGTPGSRSTVVSQPSLASAELAVAVQRVEQTAVSGTATSRRRTRATGAGSSGVRRAAATDRG